MTTRGSEQAAIIPDWLDSATAADSAGHEWALPSWVRPLGPGQRAVGTAFTALATLDDNGVMQQIMGAPPGGDILIIAGAGASRTAVIGDLTARELYVAGFRALVTDGPVRDGEELAGLPLKVWSRGTTVPASRKEHVGHVGIPVSIAGITIVPGDVVIADEGGVVIWPLAAIADLLQSAQAKHEANTQRLARVEGQLSRKSLC